MPNSNDPGKLDRVPTGVPALDDTLDGGLPKSSVILVAGLPGTGKTILCQQMMWTNAQRGETIVYLSTLSEPMVKMLRFAQTFSFFRPGMIGDGIIYGDLGSVLLQGPAPVLETLERFVQEHRPDMLVIDSFKAMRDAFEGRADFRKFASAILQRLNIWEVTALLIGEYNEEDIRQDPEFSIADGIIYLYGTEEVSRQRRMLRIMKMRGTDTFAGEHMFDITPDGIRLYPRMSPAIVGEYKFTGKRVGSEIKSLNTMLGGGIFESTSTLIAGMTGAGKTLTALSFLVAAAKEKVPGLLVSMEESPQQIIRNSQDFGWGVEKMMAEGVLEIRHVSPSELDIDRHAAEIKDRAEELGAKIVVIDSISALETSSPSPEKYRGYLWAINDHFKRTGVTTIMTAESARLFEAQDFAPQHVSLFADNIILVRSIEVEGENRRIISVPKMRGSTHDRFARELIIEAPKITVGPPFTAIGVGDRTGGG